MLGCCRELGERKEREVRGSIRERHVRGQHVRVQQRIDAVRLCGILEQEQAVARSRDRELGAHSPGGREQQGPGCLSGPEPRGIGRDEVVQPGRRVGPVDRDRAPVREVLDQLTHAR